MSIHDFAQAMLAIGLAILLIDLARHMKS